MAKPQSPDVVTAHPQPSSLCRTASPCSVRVHATIRSDCSPCSSPCAQSCTTPAAEVTQPAAVTMTDASVASQGRRSPSCTSTPSECCVHATVDVRSYCHVPPGHLPARQCQHTSPSGEGASTVSWQPKHLAQEARQCDASGSQQLHQDGADNQKGMLSPAVQQCLGMNRPHLQHCAHQSSGGNILPSVHQEPCAATRASHMYRTQRSVTRHRVSASVVREAKRVMREMSSSNSDDENQHGDSRAKHPLEAGNKGGLSFEQKSSESSCAARASVLCAVCHSPVEVTIRQSPSPTQQLELGCNLSPGKRSRAEKIKKMSSELHGLKDRSKKLVHRERAHAQELRGFLDACISSSTGGSGPGELSSPGNAVSSGGSVSFSQGDNDDSSSRQAGLPAFEASLQGTLKAGAHHHSERCAQNFASPRIAAMHPATESQLANSSAATQTSFSGARTLLPGTAVTPASDAVSQTESPSPVVHEHTQTAHLDSEASVQTDLSTAYYSRCRGDEAGARLDHLSVSEAAEVFSRPQSPTANAATQMLINASVDKGSGADNPCSHLAHLSVSQPSELFSRPQSPTLDAATQMFSNGTAEKGSGADNSLSHLAHLSVSQAAELFTLPQSPTTDAATQMGVTGTADKGSGAEDAHSHLAHLSVSEASDLFTRAQSPTVNVETQISLPGHTEMTCSTGTNAATQTDLEDSLSTDQRQLQIMPSPAADVAEEVQQELEQSTGHPLPHSVPLDEHVAASQPMDSSEPSLDEATERNLTQLTWSKESLAFRLSCAIPEEHVTSVGTMLSPDTIFSTTYGLDILPIAAESQNCDSQQPVDSTEPLESQLRSSHTPLPLISAPERDAPFSLPGSDVEVADYSIPDIAQNEPAAMPDAKDRQLGPGVSDNENLTLHSMEGSGTPESKMQSVPSSAPSAVSEKSSDGATSAGADRELSLVPQFVRHVSAEQPLVPEASDDAQPASSTFLDMNPGFDSAQPDELQGQPGSELHAVARSRDSSTAASVQLQNGPTPAHIKNLAKQAGPLWQRDKDGQPSYDRTVAGVARVKVQDPNTSQLLDTNAAPDVLPHTRASLLCSSGSPMQPSAIEGPAGTQSASASTDSETTPRSRPAPFVLPQRSPTSSSPFKRNTDAVVNLPCSTRPVFVSPSHSRRADATADDLTARTGTSPVQQVLSNQSTPRKVHKVGAADVAAWVEFGRASQSVQLAKAAKGIPGSPRAQLSVSPRSPKLQLQQAVRQSESSVSQQRSEHTWKVARGGGDVQERRETDDDIVQEGNFGKLFKYVVYSNSLYDMDADSPPCVALGTANCKQA